MSGNLGTLTYTLDADASSFNQTLNSAEGQAKHLTDSVMSAGQQMEGAFKPAEAGITDLEHRFQQLSSLHLKPEIEVNTAIAQDQLTNLQATLGKLGDYKTLLKVNAETETAHRDLTQLQTYLSRLGDHPAVVEVKANVDTALRELEQLRGEIKAVDDTTVTIGGAGGIGSVLGSIGQGAASMAAGIGIANTATNLLSSAFGFLSDAALGTNADLETASLQFETLMGSADEAQKHVRDLFQFAKATPFETGPVIEASRRLETFGGQALDTSENLTLLGDAAAATNSDISEVAFWVGRAYAAIQAGQPFGEAALRLQELAILSPQAAQGIADLQKSGADSDTVFAALTDSLGRFSGAMQKQAGTWKGLTSSVSDFLKLTAANVLAPFFKQGEEALQGFLDAAGTPEFEQRMQGWQDAAQHMAQQIHDFVVNDGPALIASLQQIGTTAIATGQSFGKMGAGLAEVIAPLGHVTDALQAIPSGTKGKSAFDDLAGGGLFGKQIRDLGTAIEDVSTAASYLGDTLHITGQETDAAELAQERYNGGLTNAIALMDKYVAAQAKLPPPPDPKREEQLNVPQVQAYDPTKSALAYNQALHDETTAAQQAALANQANGAAVAEEARGLQEATTAAATFSGAMAQIAFDTAHLTTAQTALAGAYQTGLQIQSTYSAQQSEYSGQISAIAAGQKVLDDELASGAITQDTYTQKTDLYNQALVRLQGGVQDATLTTADFAAANAILMIAQDNLSKANPQLVQGTQEFNAALKDAFIQSGGTAEQFDALAQAGVQLGDPLLGVSQVMAGPDGLITNIKEMIKQLQILNGTYVDPQVSLDTTQFDQASGTIIPTLDAIGQDTVKPAVTLDTTQFDTSSGTITATLDATSNYVATPKVDADAGLFDTKVGGVGTTIDGLDRRTAQVKIDADASNAIQAAEDALSAINKFAGGSAGPSGGSVGFAGANGEPLSTSGGGSYNATLGAFIGPVLTNVGTATTAVQDFTGQQWEATVGADTSVAQGNVDTLSGAITNLPDGYVTVTVDTSAAEAALQHIADMMPHSPAKEGPLSVPPDWSYLTAGVGVDVKPGIDGGVHVISSYLPLGGGASVGPLSQPADWSFIWAGLDQTAADAGKQAATNFESFLGNLHDIASGKAGQDLKDKLTELTDLRQIAIETNAGQGVVDELDTQIADAQARLNAIGVVMGTDVVTGMQDTIAAADVLQGLEGTLGKFNIGDIASGAALSQLQSQLDDLLATRNAAVELGLPQQVVDDLNQQINELQTQMQTVAAIAGTSAVEIVRDQQAAGEAVQQTTAAWNAALGILSSADPFKAMADQLAKVNQLQTELAVALLDPNVPQEVVAGLQANQGEAIATLNDMQAALKQALVAGLVDTPTLQAMAKAGGADFQSFYDGIFGAGALETLQAGWQAAAAIPLDELAAILPAIADHGQALIDTLVGQVEDGSRSLADAMSAISLIMGQTWHDADGKVHHGVDLAIAELKKLETELKAKLAIALVEGTDPTQLEANLQSIVDALAAVEDQANKTADAISHIGQQNLNITGTGAGGGDGGAGSGDFIPVSKGSGGAMAYWGQQIADAFQKDFDQKVASGQIKLAPPPDPTLNDALSSLAGFSTTVDELSQIISEQTGGDLGKTFADEQVKLLSDIFTKPDQFPKALRDYVESGLGTSLKALGIGPEAELEHINTLLKGAGLAPLTLDQWQQMNATVQDTLQTTSGTQVAAIQQGSADIVDAIRHPLPDPNISVAGVPVTLGAGDMGQVSGPATADDIGAQIRDALSSAPDVPIVMDGQTVATVTAGHFFRQQRQVALLVNPAVRR